MFDASFKKKKKNNKKSNETSSFISLFTLIVFFSNLIKWSYESEQVENKAKQNRITFEIVVLNGIRWTEKKKKPNSFTIHNCSLYFEADFMWFVWIIQLN